MADDSPGPMPFDAASPEPVSTSDVPPRSGPTASFWRNEWRWVALAWLGGLLVGGTFLLMSFSLNSNAEIATVAVGGVFLIVAPGSYATWQTWRGHVKNRDKRPTGSSTLESHNA